MTKIYAISAKGKTEKSQLDLRFGKCEYLAIYDSKESKLEFMENPFADGEHSGTNLVNYLIGKGITSIITGEVGPKVGDLLASKKMQIILLHEERIKIDEIIERIQS